jgi:hypothetical protein
MNAKAKAAKKNAKQQKGSHRWGTDEHRFFFYG